MLIMVLLIPLTMLFFVMAIALVFGKEPGTVGTVGGIITMLQLIPLGGAIIPTEIALRKNFDENGKRR